MDHSETSSYDIIVPQVGGQANLVGGSLAQKVSCIAKELIGCDGCS